MSQVIKPAAIRKVFTVRGTPQKAFEVFTRGIDRGGRSNTTSASHR